MDKAHGAEGILEAVIEQKQDTLKGLIPAGQSPRMYVELVKNTVMGVDKFGQPRPTDDLLLFLYVAKRTGLDPLMKQIYAIYRWDSRMGRERMTIQTGIDGMRLVAQRSNEYAGQDDVKFTPEDETQPRPVKATVTVYKLMSGQRVGFTASARWSEYVQTDKSGVPMGLWGKMPYLMLGKTAEALALRKAFPNELSGVYTKEEMDQADAPLPTPDKFKTPEPAATTAPEPVKPADKPSNTLKPTPIPDAGPDLGTMRERLKERVEKSRKAAKEAK